MPADDRYRKQRLLPQLGDAGQAKLAAAGVLVIGTGALGCSAADWLARAGVGRIVLVDRDVVERSNLHRQVLFDEADADVQSPKAVAAAQRLRHINREIEVTSVVADVTSDNIRRLLCDHVPAVILDGTDNAQTRYLINDAAIEAGMPWVYGGCVAAEGRVMSVLPGVGPCLRCVFREPPAAAELATCESAGVLGPAVGIVGAQQATLAMRLIVGDLQPAELAMLSFDAWRGRWHSTPLGGARDSTCPACGCRQFDFLNAPPAPAKLCGRDAVQLRLIETKSADRAFFDRIGSHLASAGRHFSRTDHLLRCELDGLRLSLFADGRLLVHGTSDLARARAVVARYFG